MSSITPGSKRFAQGVILSILGASLFLYHAWAYHPIFFWLSLACLIMWVGNRIALNGCALMNYEEEAEAQLNQHRAKYKET